MRLKISSVSMIVAVFMIGAVTASFTFAVTPEKDACLLLTQTQVGDAVGVAVGAGSHVNAQFLKTCTWMPTTSPKQIKAITLNIQPGDTYDSAKKNVELAATAAENGPKVTPGIGIGDDAYYMAIGSDITQLIFKKGTLAFKIAIYGAFPSEKAMAAEKTLAQEILSKL